MTKFNNTFNGPLNAFSQGDKNNINIENSVNIDYSIFNDFSETEINSIQQLEKAHPGLLKKFANKVIENGASIVTTIGAAGLAEYLKTKF